TLASLPACVNELVVVDGAYSWLVPYYESVGVNPHKSDERLYRILETSGLRYRVLAGIWKNELEKRVAGFTACTNRYVLRVDADEIYFFDDAVLDDFFARVEAVAEMTWPIMYDEKTMITRHRRPLSRQCFLFDKEKITASDHNHYLELVLTTDALPTLQRPRFRPYGRPVAFAAHLTHWRTPATAITRAAFYITNWVRANGKGTDKVRDYFKAIQPTAFKNALANSRFVIGTYKLNVAEKLQAAPLSKEQRAILAPLYEKFRQATPRPTGGFEIISGEAVYFELPSISQRKLKIAFDDRPAQVRAIIHTIRPEAPHYEAIILQPIIKEKSAALHIQDTAGQGCVRRVLEISIQHKDDKPHMRGVFV
ncbi:hypothetical protein, partial [Paludibacterium sp.]|uniref:hypothetical protein n=1 Tax=Paludibacterium sp. TaxID=1917523 RepID=UPI0025CEF034